MNCKTDYLNRLVELSLRIANIVDRKGRQRDCGFAEELGLGYLALSSDLRRGARAVIDVQEEHSVAKHYEYIAKSNLEENEKFLEDIFGDRDIASICDEDKQKIREFVKSIENEWESKDEVGGDRMEKLKKCPFCGKKDSLQIVKCGGFGHQYRVGCSIYLHGCGASSVYAETEQEAIEAWNRRCTD